ncbi:MAG: filamentous hemagglutinin N-terminal domain-containing protein [Pseudomonadota bacterium]
MRKNAECGDSLNVKTWKSFRRKLLPLLIAGCFNANTAWANPADAQVVNGQVSFSKQGNLLSITNSPGSIINWQNFSINPGEITRFTQQNGSSSVLNRIVGQNPSHILGALQSNGRVFLINPNGVVFGQGAQIDVNGLVASTLSISNEDFLSGRLHFKAGASAGNLENQGVITTPTGGHVYLIAPNVENSGIINSPKGEVLLAAGHSVQLVDSKNPDLHVVVSAPENTAINLGQIITQGGKTGIYGALIKQRGTVNANSAVVGENGKIVFKATKDTLLEEGSKTLATSAGKGGEIHVLGNRVGLAGDTEVDASGQTGGGSVLIGGDVHGENAEIKNAARTYVDQNAIIKADAIQQGDGGKIIVWSDELTRVNGSLSARGGKLNGTGGFVETSSKKQLDFHAKVDVTAQADKENSKGGTLLLDPATITIVGGTGDGRNVSDGTTTFQGSQTPGTINFSDSDISSTGVSNIYQSELEGMTPGTNIVLEATDYINVAGSFSNRVTLPMYSNLTMRTRNASTDASGSIGINLLSSHDASNLEFKTQGPGSITLQTGTGNAPQAASISAGKLTTEGGQVVLDATGNISLVGVTTTPRVSAQGGNISARSATGSLSFVGSLDTRGNLSNAGNITLVSAGDITAQATQPVYANELTMLAVSGMRGATNSDSIHTQVNSLHALNTGNGPIRISNSVTPLSLDDRGYAGYAVQQAASGQGIFISNASSQGIAIHSQLVTNNGNVEISAAGGIAIAPYQPILTKGGSVTLHTTDANALIYLPFNSLIYSEGGAVTLQADTMSLLGKINAGTSVVSLLPHASIPIHLGTLANTTGGNTNTINTDTNALELSGSALNNVTAGVLKLGNANSGAIDIQSTLSSAPGQALEHISTALHLTSGAAITQQANALIGLPAVSANGATVSLIEANPTGVVSGSSTSGDFQYRSANLLTISNVDNVSGITAPSTATIKLISDSPLGINQTVGSTINTHGGALVVKSMGSILLAENGNEIGKFAADLQPAGSTGSTVKNILKLYSAIDMDIAGPFFEVNGINTHDQDFKLATGPGKTLSIHQPISGGGGRGELQADSLALNNGVSGTLVDIHPATSGRNITVGSSVCNVAPCLNVMNLYQIAAPTIGIGNDEASKGAGDIHVVGITDSNTHAVTDINHGVTTRIGLLSGGNITQEGVIKLQDLGVSAGGLVNLNLNNEVSNLVAETQGGNFSFVNANGLTVTTLSDNVEPYTYSLSGVTTHNGNVSLTARTGDIHINELIDAGAGSVTLTAATGAIAQSISSSGSNSNNSSRIIGSSLSTIAQGGIGHDNALTTQVDTLSATNSGATTDINVTNDKALLALQTIAQSTAGSHGNININTSGKLTLASGNTVSTQAGDIYLKAERDVNLDGAVSSSGGSISVVAGAATLANGAAVSTSSTAISGTTGNLLPKSFSTAYYVPAGVSGTSTPVNESISSSPSPGNLNLNASIQAESGNVTLMAGGAISQNAGRIIGSSLNLIANDGIGNGTPLITEVGALTAANLGANTAIQTPTKTDINITNTGALLLQNIAQNTLGSGGNITIKTTGPLRVASGKTVLADTGNISLQTDNTLTVDGAVQCLSGGAITLEAGVTGSAQNNLLTINGAINTQPATGVAVATSGNVLLKAGDAITINGSISNNVTQQSYLNLPTLTQCITTPTLSGCSSVLPTLSQCTTTPTLMGCSIVLPTVNQCTTTPTLPGCTSVLPTLSQCTTTPTLAGCSVVLPTVSQCTITPTLAGCNTVLPPVQTQVNTPTSPVAVALNSTVTAINSSTVAVTQLAPTNSTPTSTTATAPSSSQQETTSTGSSSTTDKSEKDDASSTKKDAKNTTTETSGAKKNDVAKKMYCN